MYFSMYNICTKISLARAMYSFCEPFEPPLFIGISEKHARLF